MSCQQLKCFETGKVSEEHFLEHIEECSACRIEYEKDRKLMDLAASLRSNLDPGNLWEKIEDSFPDEQNELEILSGSRYFRLKPQTLRWAASLLVTVGLASILYFSFLTPASGSKLLNTRALNKVERLEAAYASAIEELEQQARPKLKDLDIELAFHYRERLETIDEQIEQCKQAVEENPANSHIRRYLMAALQDKRETLGEILIYKPELTDNGG